MASFDPFTPRPERPWSGEPVPPVRPPARPVQPRRSVLVPVLCVLVGLCLLLQAGQIVYAAWYNNPKSYYREVTPRGDLAEDEKATIRIYSNVRPSVVHITTMAVQQNTDANGLGTNVQKVPEGTGTGIVWDDQGHVVTNYHVIKNADEAVVTMADQSSWTAKLVGAYPDKDLAVLSIRANKGRLVPIQVGRSSDLQVGQKVFAIGNPFGLDQTLTTGIISALDREIESVTRRPIRGVIQTDAAINPGNSGGPLLDSAGLLIGINTAIYSPSGSSAGIGFAIPVDEVRRLVPQLIEHGKVTRPGLGVQVASDQLAGKLGQEGALVMAVQPGSPAEKAGLRPTRKEGGKTVTGDVITAVDGQPVKKVSDLFNVLDGHNVGDKVSLQVRRDGKTLSLEATLAPLE
jgi:S1-C subfamily serine protease